ncbi:10212_t:CDS:2 [Entrophospora sp. SA101]|nr:10212_t:CDS:2 [Entrophospora sp. SA101]
MNNIVILGGSSHPQLAEQIATRADASHKRSGAPLSHKQTNNPTGYTYDTPAILDPIFTSPLSSQVDDPFSAAFKKFGEQNSSSNGLDGLSTRSIANNNDGNSGSNNNGYRHWIAQSGTLVANLLTCAGYYISSVIDQVIVSNSVPQDEHEAQCSKIKVFNVAPILAEAIKRAHNGGSVSALLDHKSTI